MTSRYIYNKPVMDLIDYRDRVARLTVGKKVGNAVYVHADALRRVDSVLWDWLRSFADNAKGVTAQIVLCIFLAVFRTPNCSEDSLQKAG